MSFGLSASGFSRKRFADIRADLESELRRTFGAGVNLQPDSVFAMLVGIFARQLDEVWQLAEEVYNGQYPDTAAGTSLDNVAALVGVSRLGATQSVVRLLAIGTRGTRLATGMIVSVRETRSRFETVEPANLIHDLQQHRVVIRRAVARAHYRVLVNDTEFDYEATNTDSASSVATELAARIRAGAEAVLAAADQDGSIELVAFEPGAENRIDITATAPRTWVLAIVRVLVSTDYKITIGGREARFRSGPAATLLDVIDGLVDAVNRLDIGAEAIASAGTVRITDNGVREAIVARVEPESAFTLTDATALSGDLVALSTATLTAAEIPALALEPGPVAAPAGSLVRIETPVAGWVRAINPREARLGRTAETDFELRLRRRRSLQVAGFSVVEAIRARLLQDVPAVRNVFVVENELDVEVDGRTPHSFEVVIDGGDDDAIARRLWEIKPAGIRPVSTSGTPVVRTVTDSMGFEHVIRFSRPERLFIWLHIALSRHPEEDFPEGGEAIIQERVSRLGDNLAIGEDVVLSRFIGEVHRVPGIYDVQIRIAVSAVEDSQPDVGAFARDNLPVAFNQLPEFASRRIRVEMMA